MKNSGLRTPSRSGPSSGRAPRIWGRPDAWELREARGSQACYHEHLHDTLSVGQILRGESICRITGSEYGLRTGNIVCIPAFALHACNPRDARIWSYRMLHVASGWLASHNLRQPQGAGPVADARTTGACFAQLAQVLGRAATGAADAMRNTENASGLAIDAALLKLLHSLKVLPWADTALAEKPATGPALRVARDYLQAHACEPVGLAELAAIAGLDAWRLLRGFRRAFAVTPHALQQSLRVQQARRWVQQGMPLVEVALRAGFSDQSHFSHVFRRHTSLSPGRYRNALRPHGHTDAVRN
ncbi:hypothetical protein OPIT5_11930 [Opitutaceae bacterium TAV5]|nr:hypothetical protein OPIT5_11930 [Opitutaceae bacterium TAV5]